jgi:hypothetical protein
LVSIGHMLMNLTSLNNLVVHMSGWDLLLDTSIKVVIKVFCNLKFLAHLSFNRSTVEISTTNIELKIDPNEIEIVGTLLLELISTRSELTSLKVNMNDWRSLSDRSIKAMGESISNLKGLTHLYLNLS